MSFRLRLLNHFMRLVVKRRLTKMSEPIEAQEDFDRMGRRVMRAPPFLTVRRGGGGLAWVHAGAPDRKQVILYLHGGGYIAGSVTSHGPMVARLSQLSGMEVAMVDYRLAPTHPFPAAFEDAVAGWDHLRALGYAPADIILAGDSAGGGLALALLAYVLERGERPRGVVAFSPWTDLACTGESLKTNAATEAMLPVARIGELVDYCLQGADPHDPRISPLYADFKCSPPVLLFGSETEILRDDVARMAARLKEAGAQVQEIWEEDAPHVWAMFAGYIPEARSALEAAAYFCRSL